MDVYQREIKRPRKYTEADLAAYALTVVEETNEGREPQTYFKGMFFPNSSKCLAVMHEQIEYLSKNDT